MSDSTNPLPQVSQNAIQRETLINELMAGAGGALTYARNPETTAALTWGYLGGRVDGTSVANGTVALTASNTNYVVAHRTTLVVSASTSNANWNNTLVYARLYLVIAGGSTITSYEDHRLGSSGILSSGTGSASSSGLTINAQTGTTYTVLSTDLAKLVTFSNTSAVAVTLPQATGAFTAPFYFYAKNLNIGAVTITPATSTINGLSTLVLRLGESVIIVSDGTDYQTTLQPPGPLVNAQTGTTYTYLNSDRGKLVTHTNGSSIAGTLPQATGAFGLNWFMWVQNRGVGTLTITPTTSTIDGAASLAFTTGQGCIIFSDGTNYYTSRGMGAGGAGSKVVQFACSDLITDLTTGTEKAVFRMPYAMTVTEVRASLATAASGSPTVLTTINIKESGSTILSTKITIDHGEKTSTTAATPPVISDASLADDAEITVDIDVAGGGSKGLVVTLIGT